MKDYLRDGLESISLRAFFDAGLLSIPEACFADCSERDCCAASAAQATAIINFEDATADDTLVTTTRYNELGIAFVARQGLDLLIEQTGNQVGSSNGFVVDQVASNSPLRFDSHALGFVPTAQTPGLGNYFLRSNTLTQTLQSSGVPVFSIVNLRRVIGPISGQIWDIDGSSAVNAEQWRVDARDGNGMLLGSILSPLGTTNNPSSLDGRAWSFGFSESSPFLRQIAQLDFVFTGGKTIGLCLAFDNFNSGTRGFTREVQRYQAKRIWTFLPVSASRACMGVLKPRHFLGVRL